jgi:hypothetical protein
MSWLKLIAELGININPYVQGLFRARGEAQKFGKDVGKTLSNSLAGAFGVAAVTGLARKTMELGGSLTDLKQRLDVGTTALQEWHYAATQNGAAAEDVTSFFEKIADAQTNALRGNEESLASFQRLGVSLEDLKKLRTDEIAKKIAETVRGGDVQKLTADLKDIGGKSATKLVAAFKGGITEAAAEAHALGQIIEEDLIKQMDDLGDRSDQVLKNLMGPMATMLGWLNKGFTSMTQFFQLLGAYSVQWDWKKFRFNMSFSEFAGTQEAQAIVKEQNKPELPTVRSPGTFTEKAEKAKKETFDKAKEVGRLSADAMASVGGFIGRAGGGNPLLDVARQQLLEQRLIAKNTNPGGKLRAEF